MVAIVAMATIIIYHTIKAANTNHTSMLKDEQNKTS